MSFQFSSAHNKRRRLTGGLGEATTLHVGFTIYEAEIVRSLLAKDEGPLPGMDVFREIGYHAERSPWRDCLVSAVQLLPGREVEDVFKFIEDCYRMKKKGLPYPFAGYTMVLKPERPHTTGSASLRLLREMGSGVFGFSNRREQTRAMESMARDGMQPWRIFKEGSSDIIDISWSPDGSRFALCCKCDHVIVFLSVQ